MSITVKKTLKIRNKTTNQFEPLAAIRGRDGADGQQGPQGISGATGPQGPAGEDGHTPTTEEIEEVCADALADITTELEEAKRKIKFLDEMSKGQLYDFEEKSESGTSVSPSGAKYQSLLAVDGKTEQTRWNGYNLADISAFDGKRNGNISVSVDGDWIVLNGDTLSETSAKFIGISLSQTIATEARIILVNSALTAAEDTNCGVRLQATDNSTPSYIAKFTVENATQSVGATATWNQVQMRIPPGYTFNNYRFKVMVEKGSTAHSYEPYVGGIPSPNPSYPQEVKGIEELNVRVGSRQLSQGIEYQKYWEANIYGVKNSGNATADARCLITNPISVRGGETFTVSASVSESITVYYRECKDRQILRTRNVSLYVPSGNQAVVSKSFTVSEDCDEIFLFLVATSSTQMNETKCTSVMLEVGSTAHPYEPFSEETRTIIPPKPLYKVGDYVDRLDVNSGDWVYNTDKFIANSITGLTPSTSEGIRRFNVSTALENIPTSDTNRYARFEILSNQYVYIGQSQTVGGCFLADRRIYFAHDDQSISNTATMIQRIKDDGAYFIYPLATSVTEPMADADLEWLKSFDGLATDKVWTITDQDGNDVSYLLKYIVKTSEV